MSRFVMATLALATVGAIGFVARSQAPEVKRYFNVKKM